MKKKLYGILIAIAAAAVWTFALLYSQNTLLQNKNWLPFYASPFAGGSNGYEQLMARKVLASFQLNPGHFGLRHQLVSRKDFQIQEIAADADMGKLSMVTLGVTTPEGSTLIRFSSHPLLPSLFYQTDKNEKVLNTVVIPGKIPQGRMKLILKKTTDKTIVLADGKEIFATPVVLTSGRVFVKVYSAVVKNLEVNSGEGLQSLPFRNDFNFLPFFWPMALVLCAVGFFSIRFSLLVLIIGILWSIFDFTYYSKQNVRFNARELTFESIDSPVNFEGFRIKVFVQWFRLAGGEIPLMDKLKQNRRAMMSFAPFRKCEGSGCRRLVPHDYKSLINRNDNLKILMIGGSLIGGWGTTGINDYYPAHLLHFLEGKVKKKTEIVTVSGFVPTAFKFTPEDFRRIIKVYKPHFVVLEFQPAGIDPEMLKAIISSKTEGARLLALHAPKDLPSSAPEDFPRENLHFSEDKKVLAILRDAGIMVFNSNTFFLSPENYLTRILFIDHSHLNREGHEELGNFMGREMLPEIKKAGFYLKTF